MFYRNYNRFKSAYDAAENRIVYTQVNGKELGEVSVCANDDVYNNRELTEEEKEQIMRRDGYKCV